MNTFIDTPVLVTLQHCWEAARTLLPLLLLILGTLATLTIGGRQ
jgi:hypothetical protein